MAEVCQRGLYSFLWSSKGARGGKKSSPDFLYIFFTGKTTSWFENEKIKKTRGFGRREGMRMCPPSGTKAKLQQPGSGY
jgi:hypothetical protein